MNTIYVPKGKAREYGDYALNIYTGCPHRCYYCVDKQTPILMADGTVRNINDIKIGDEIMGVVKENGYYKFHKTIVINKFSSHKPAYQITLENGTKIISSAEHRWLTKHRGWKHTTSVSSGYADRPHLTTNNSLLGYGDKISNYTLEDTEDYKRGYLSGIINGDGTIGHYSYKYGKIHSFRLAMKEKEAIERVKEYLCSFGVTTNEFIFKNPNGSKIPAIRISGEKVFEIDKIISVSQDDETNSEFLRGFLSGFYDAEGTFNLEMRVSNTNEYLLEVFKKGLTAFQFRYVVENNHQGKNKNVKNIRILGGISEALRFKQIVNLAIKSKLDIENSAIKTKEKTNVASIEDLGEIREMIDITTTTGNFIANGCVAHNCFAPNVLHRDREVFHSCVEPRANIVKETEKYIKTHNIKGKLIHLCFTCDPYPTGYDSSVTREIIKVIKDSGNNVQILTKGDGSRDFDLLDENDWYGITLDGQTFEENSYTCETKKRIGVLAQAAYKGIKTWVSFEPVTDESQFFWDLHSIKDFVDKVKIGKLNYHPTDIDWKSFGEKAEAVCKQFKIDYYIKDSLRAEMNK